MDHQLSLKRLREELDQWVKQIPSSAHWHPAYSEPECVRWYYLNEILLGYENGQVSSLETMTAARAHIKRWFVDAVIWDRCARTAMIVAAFNGDRWNYDGPIPELKEA